MMAFAVCLDAEVLIPRSVELGLQTIGVTVVHGTLLAALTWMVTRLKFFRLRPALCFALWALVLLKFFMPSGPALVSYAPSALFESAFGRATERAFGMLGAGGAWTRAAWEDLLSRPQTLAGMLLIASYVTIVLLLLRRWQRGQRALARRVAEMPRADEGTQAILLRCSRALGVRPPELRITDEPWTPMVVGCLRPVVVLPAWLLREPELVESVLLHELGHISRRDPWSHQLQRLAEAVFFFWPVIYWVTGRLRESREMACDALVLTHSGVSAFDYGSALLRIAKHVRHAPQPAMLGAAACGRRLLERRIDYLLRPHPCERWSMPLLAGIGAWGLLVLSGAQPTNDKPGLLDAARCRDSSPDWLADEKLQHRRALPPAGPPGELSDPTALRHRSRPGDPGPSPGRGGHYDDKPLGRIRPQRALPPCGCRRTLSIHAAAFPQQKGTSATRNNFPRSAAG
jgi:beta-lactamase regulating signal transducer with metallopeptidase domain